MTHRVVLRVGPLASGVILCLGLLAPAGVSAAAPKPESEPTRDIASTVVPGSWIVTLKPGADRAAKVPGLAKAAGGEAGKVFEHAMHRFVFNGSAQAAAALMTNPNVQTVIANRTIHATAESAEPGIRRIRAEHPTQPDAHDSGFRGAGVRVAIMDTGIDLTHPDLVANLDIALGKNCMNSALPPQDGHGHGTHVAGIVAAVGGNGIGVVGVAPSARLVPFKVLDDTGSGEWSNLICAIDIVTGYATDSDPSNDIQIVNMSLGDTGTLGSCNDGGIRQAICTSVAAGVTYVAAAGNSTVDTAGFIPAAFPEVIAVSAITDLDGEPGGLGGCWLVFIFCDDAAAEFSNYGAAVDVAAPGTRVTSTWMGGGYNTIDGTSMASPHAAGVAALVKAANHSLSPADIKAILEAHGECANGLFADEVPSGDCVGQGTRANDPDGYGEPLVNALRAAQAANGWDARPTVHLTAPSSGASVSGVVALKATASDDHAVASVAFRVNGTLLSTDSDGSNGWSASWDTSGVQPGSYTISATAADTSGQTATDALTVTTGVSPQGNWTGKFGQDGYALFAWNATTDVALLPTASLTLDAGSRDSQGVTTEVRALTDPTATERRATAYWDPDQVQFHLTFGTAYTGSLHLYAMDWATVDRREKVTINDGTGPRSVTLDAGFHDGAWIHFPISVGGSGTVTVTVDRIAGSNALISGLFLGGGGAAPPATVPGAPTLATPNAATASIGLAWTAPASDGGSPISGYRVYRGTSSGGEALLASLGNVTTWTDTSVAGGATYYYVVRASNAIGDGPPSSERSAQVPELPGVQGNWTGKFGQDGYALFAWNATTDVALLPTASLTLDAGSRDSQGVTTEVRALTDPTATERRATAYWDPDQVRFHLTFGTAYTGSLHLYAMDWATVDRREKVTINDGTGPRSVTLDAGFHDGAWIHFPISVGGSGTVTVTVDRIAGSNALISGLFLGGGGAAPPATAPGAPTLTAATRGNGQVALAWTAPSSNGGSTILDYTGTASPGGATCTVSGLGCTIGGLANGTSYSFTVTARNAVGSGSASNSLSATPATVPGSPTLTAATPGNGQVALAWTAPASTGGSPITGYVATASPGGSTCSATSAGCTVTALANGTAYSFTVVASNAVGPGSASNGLSATPVAPASVPGAPTLNSATAGVASVALSWSAPASNGGSTVIDYTATASPGGAICTTAGLGCTVSGLSNGVSYSFTVTARNAIGSGGASNSLSATPTAAPTAPGAPTLTAATRGNGQVALAWTAPSSNGGSTILDYTGTASPGGATCTVSGLGCTIGGLANGTSYSFTVTARNAVGSGSASNTPVGHAGNCPRVPDPDRCDPGQRPGGPRLDGAGVNRRQPDHGVPHLPWHDRCQQGVGCHAGRGDHLAGHRPDERDHLLLPGVSDERPWRRRPLERVDGHAGYRADGAPQCRRATKRHSRRGPDVGGSVVERRESGARVPDLPLDH